MKKHGRKCLKGTLNASGNSLDHILTMPHWPKASEKPFLRDRRHECLEDEIRNRTITIIAEEEL